MGSFVPKQRIRGAEESDEWRFRFIGLRGMMKFRSSSLLNLLGQAQTLIPLPFENASEHEGSFVELS